MNTLQVNYEEEPRLYSTFPNLNQPCYLEDTSFMISQIELKMYLDEFVLIHYQHLGKEVRDKLVASSVLVQDEYVVLYCKGN